MGTDQGLPTDDRPLAGRLAVWLATGLGLGMVAPAPGTFAGLWGLALAAATSMLSPIGAQLSVIALLVVLSVFICERAAAALGAGADPGAIVLDEIVALPIVYLGVGRAGWKVLLVGYLLFRICDIVKPGLARAAEKLRGGWGIVADDCVAAVMACLLLHAALWLDRTTGLAWLTAAA